MPIALDGDGGVTIRRSNSIRGMPSISICDRGFPPERDVDDSDSSSSSSIGRNSASSEDSSDREDSGENEVQSTFKGPLDTINDLEEVLPVKKGISKFYSGKSKSFTSLADASSATSMQDIVKPEDPYAKKRKNLLARGLSKRPANLGRGTSCLTLSSLSSSGNSEEGNSVSPPSSRPPLHPHAKRPSTNASPPRPPDRNSPWRSYSWSDLQSAAAEAHDISGLTFVVETKATKYTEILTEI